MIIAGISCHYHDSAACLIKNGEILAAAEEERFTREKHSSVFPREALNFCIQKAGLTFAQVDHVAFYEKPYLKFARTLYDHLEEFPFSLKHFVRSMPHWLGERLVLPEYLKDEMALEAPVSFVPHHLSHAAYSYFLSGFSEAAILTLDGVGEFSTSTRGVGKGSQIQLLEETRYPHSLGLFYSAIAEHLGFSAVGGEGKLMGLAAYGKANRMEEMEKIMRVGEDGAFVLDPRYFSYRRGSRMGSARLEKLLGPIRAGEITDHHRDIAASAQAQLEKAILANARSLRASTKAKNLCLGGGVALNCLANGRVLREAGFESVFVPPGCGDSGGAIGAAFYLSSLLGEKPKPSATSYWGPQYLEREILRELKAANVKFEKYEEPELLAKTSSLLAQEKIVGWFQGAMEFGPRALGNRSILASPLGAAMKDRVNETKRREKFRPFAPVVPLERATEFFEMKEASPFMLFATKVKAGLPAVTHVDGTARAQTITKEANPLLFSLLEKMDPPVLLNTSFNLDDEPVVCSPYDAVRCFTRSKLDALAIGPFLVLKN